ncbi:probable E3 ubiquitin-protein ligase RHB1A [Vicia villosa]|uniref:probable E3 ubiquitin-protein ligase RHB1A n=1 Tax=Vicia villosa TaxID=3911 RepID=UPI00273C37BF|nr:probable E3 ubiquitin-protein ligase RHB1A [Vicia villosa]XP_058784720.1 probable E3 ubiquitin-protein ligase RHB1A [Vicia villosa]
MDEYHCDVNPNHSSDLNNISSSCPADRYFIAEFNCTNMYVLSARRFRTSNVTQSHNFIYVTKEEMIQKTTIESWLSETDIPQDAYRVVESKILECLEDMVKTTHKNSTALPIRVDICIPRATEDESSESEVDGDDEIDESSESDEDISDQDQDIEFVPAAKSCIEKLEKVEKEGKCSICFEDFNVCLVMPCSHMYHPKCISDWLEIGHSCPLCRFELPT